MARPQDPIGQIRQNQKSDLAGRLIPTWTYAEMQVARANAAKQKEAMRRAAARSLVMPAVHRALQLREVPQPRALNMGPAEIEELLRTR